MQLRCARRCERRQCPSPLGRQRTTKALGRPARAGRRVRGVFWRGGEWWIRWACTLGHDHRKPSGELKTAATEEHKAKRAEVREARKAGRECCPRLVMRSRPALFEEILADYMEHSRRNKRPPTTTTRRSGDSRRSSLGDWRRTSGQRK